MDFFNALINVFLTLCSTASDVSEEINVPPFLPNGTREAKETMNHEIETESSVTAKENDDDIDIQPCEPKVRITLSTDPHAERPKVLHSSDNDESNV